jgi:hypothetical protein
MATIAAFFTPPLFMAKYKTEIARKTTHFSEQIPVRNSHITTVLKILIWPTLIGDKGKFILIYTKYKSHQRYRHCNEFPSKPRLQQNIANLYESDLQTSIFAVR